jgi:hypothetical protein
LIETVFGSIKHYRGCHRSIDERVAVRVGWRLITATHSMLKLHKHHPAAGHGGKPRRREQRSREIASPTDLRDSPHSLGTLVVRERWLSAST